MCNAWHAACSISVTSVFPFTIIGDTIMPVETFMLRGLFIACLTVCGLIFGAMMTATPPGIQLAAAGKSRSIAATASPAPMACALPADGVICLPKS